MHEKCKGMGLISTELKNNNNNNNNYAENMKKIVGAV